MAQMKIKILGNGGFYNEGLAYNALAIDGHVLVELRQTFSNPFIVRE